MSYARYEAGHSDVYIVGTGRDSTFLECMGCELATPHANGTKVFTSTTFTGMFDHVQTHLKAGHLVPKYAVKRLKKEAKAE